mmetsp:Transcript_74631/g.230670  ORF Transcript_74631/g.230670 Transcript_74631/m.230670 type:complete len:243 (-) Transcript_74631:20-748(-)
MPVVAAERLHPATKAARAEWSETPVSSAWKSGRSWRASPARLPSGPRWTPSSAVQQCCRCEASRRRAHTALASRGSARATTRGRCSPPSPRLRPLRATQARARPAARRGSGPAASTPRSPPRACAAAPGTPRPARRACRPSPGAPAATAPWPACPWPIAPRFSPPSAHRPHGAPRRARPPAPPPPRHPHPAPRAPADGRAEPRRPRPGRRRGHGPCARSGRRGAQIPAGREAPQARERAGGE